MTDVRARKVGPALIDGDPVVINRVFDFVMKDGQGFTLDEVAWQTWRNDRLLRERFYCDPGQTRAAKQAPA